MDVQKTALTVPCNPLSSFLYHDVYDTFQLAFNFNFIQVCTRKVKKRNEN